MNEYRVQKASSGKQGKQQLATNQQLLVRNGIPIATAMKCFQSPSVIPIIAFIRCNIVWKTVE